MPALLIFKLLTSAPFVRSADFKFEYSVIDIIRYIPGIWYEMLIQVEDKIFADCNEQIPHLGHKLIGWLDWVQRA